MRPKREVVAVLFGRAILAGGIVRIESPEGNGISADETFDLPAGLSSDDLTTLFSRPPLDRVAILWCGECEPRERLRLGDIGVRVLRAAAPLDRIRSVSRAFLEFPVERWGEFLVPVSIEIGSERWDAPAGLSVLLCFELLGGELDRPVLCFANDCSRCESIVVETPGGAPERRRACQLPAKDGIRVVEPCDACRWPGDLAG